MKVCMGELDWKKNSFVKLGHPLSTEGARQDGAEEGRSNEQIPIS